MGQCGSVPEDGQVLYPFSLEEKKMALKHESSGRLVLVDTAVATFSAARVFDGVCVKQVHILRIDDATIAQMKRLGFRASIPVRHYLVTAKTSQMVPHTAMFALVPIPSGYWTVRFSGMPFRRPELKFHVIRRILFENPSFTTLKDVENWRAALFSLNGIPPDARIVAEIPYLS